MNIGTLQMGLSLNLNPFAQGLQQSASMMSQWASRIQQQSNRALSNLQNQMRGTGRGGQAMGAQLMGGFGAPMSSLSGLIGRLGGLYGALELTKRGLSIISDLNRLERSLRAVSTSTADFERAQAFVKNTAQSLGQEYQSLTKAYVGLKAAAQGTAIEGAATEKIFLSVAKASAALGLSSEQTEGSLLALQQMMSKGNVSAEELRGQLGERLPGAFRLMAQGLGVTESKLNKMLEQGEVLASVALPKLAAQLEKTYGASAQNGLKGMAGGWAKVTTEVQLLLKEFDNAVGVDAFFGKVLSGIADMASALSGLVRSVDFKTFSDLLSGRTSISDVLKGSATKDFDAKKRAADLAEFRRMGAEERKKAIEDTRADLETMEGMLEESSRQPDTPERIKRENELEASKQRLGKKLNEQQWEDNELSKEEARNALRAKNQKPEGKKGKDKAEYQPKEGYEGQKEWQSYLEDRIKTVVSSGKTDDKTMNYLNAITKAYQAVSDKIREVEEEWDKLSDKESRPVDLEVNVRNGVVTDKLEFRGQIGGSEFAPSDALQGKTRQFAPLPQTITPDMMEGKLGEQKSNLANAHVRESMEQLAKLANAYRDIQRAFDASAAPAAEARFDEIYQAALAGGMRIEEAFDKAYTTVVSAGQQLQSGLTNALQGAAQGAAEGFGELVGSIIAGVGSLNDLPTMLGRLFASIATQMGKAMIAFGTAGIALKAFAANPVTAIVAGIGLVALGSAMEASMQKSMQSGTSGGLRKFAKGAVVDSPTVAMFGEYTNADFNKEIATPEKLMASIFRRELDKDQPIGIDTGSSGRSAVDVNVQLSALRLSNDYIEIGGYHAKEKNDDIYGRRG